MAKLKRRLQDAEERAKAEEKRANDAEKRAKAEEKRADDAEERANDAEKRAALAEARFLLIGRAIEAAQKVFCPLSKKEEERPTGQPAQ